MHGVIIREILGTGGFGRRMKKIQIELEKSNMIPLLAGSSFYISWDVFIRELLINAIDACNVRQALEWSWGTEFLEMEQARNMRQVRQIYTPEISISYDSSSRMFAVEDNGIGINEYDLQQYVSRIGLSYYNSDDFRNQKLDYRPLSHHGIGLCSCFSVARAVLIESKKDKVINTAWNVSNPQQVAPIMAKWFDNGNSMEYVISQKTTAGTKVTVPLKHVYAQHMSIELIESVIRKYMLCIPIPITIVYDGQTKRLYQQKPEWNYPQNEFVGMNVIRVDTRLLEGYIAIYHPKHKDLFEKSMLYQQNILVTAYGETLDLKPHWLDSFSYQLNIKTDLLNLSASRDSAAHDEKLVELRQYIGQIIIDYFGQSPLTLAQFLSDGRSSLLGEYEAENELISRALQIKIYLRKKEVEVPIRTVINGFMGRKIKIAYIDYRLFKNFNQNYPYDYSQFVEKYDMIVFEQNIRAFWQFLAPYIQSMEYIMGDTPGMIYTEVVADMTNRKAPAAYRDSYVLRPEYYDIDPVFCLVSNELTDPMQIVLNEHNRNVMLLERAKEHQKVRHLKAVIIENIKQRILGNASHWNCIVDYGGELVHEYKGEKPMSMQAVWCLEREFPDEINEYIAKTLTVKELDEYGLTSLFFTKDDFIKWWIAP